MAADTDCSMSVLDHLAELRSRLIKYLIVLGLITAALLPFAQDLFYYFALPLTRVLPPEQQLLSVGVASPVLGPLKVTLFCAFSLSLPFLLQQLWAFAAPGLYRREKKICLSFMLSSLMMFALGVAYCYGVVFSFVFKFVAQFAPQSINFAPDIDSYISFVLHLCLAFGLSFEIPVALLILCRIGVLRPAVLSKARPYVIVGAFAAAAVLTPPDVISQFLLALPIIALFEAGRLLCVLSVRKAAPKPSAPKAA